MTDIKHARLAVATIFFMNGSMFGSWAAHIPLVKSDLDLSKGSLGLAFLMIGLGSLIAMPMTGPLITRFGSAQVTRWSASGFAIALPAAALAPSWGFLLAGLFYLGIFNGALDVAMNAHGTLVERQMKRAIMSSFHGMFSLGGLVGALAALPLLAQFGAGIHVGLVTVFAGLLTVLSIRYLLPTALDKGTSGEPFALPKGRSIILGALAFVAFLAEGSMLDWSGIYLQITLDAPATVAASGFAAFSATMAIGRFAGDRIRERVGPVTLLILGGLMIGGGIGFALSAISLAVALTGFAIAGLGASNLVPVLIVAAGKTDEARPGEQIAAVATLGYLGLLLGPPVIGLIAEMTSLGFGLAFVAATSLLIVIGARVAR